MSWLKDVFGVQKPIIAMCHLEPLPGDPGYKHEKGVEYIVECARKNLAGLQDGGVDAIMFSNEQSLPYLTKVEPITYVTMARIIGEIRREIKLPFGVNVLWDPTASIDLAVAVGGLFVREIFSGVIASDFGLWEGRLVEATSSTNQDFLTRVLATDPGASVVGEFALGTNMAVDRFCKDILIDEKIGGTMHMAMGRSYPECGGKNTSGRQRIQRRSQALFRRFKNQK